MARKTVPEDGGGRHRKEDGRRWKDTVPGLINYANASEYGVHVEAPEDLGRRKHEPQHARPEETPTVEFRPFGKHAQTGGRNQVTVADLLVKLGRHVWPVGRSHHRMEVAA